MHYYRVARDGTVIDGDSGRVVKAPKVLARIKALGIPPAYNNVKVAKDPKAHIWATGQDAKGRTQYLYNPDFVQEQRRARFAKIRKFHPTFVRLVRAIRKNISSTQTMPNPTRDICMILHLMLICNFRIGNDKYSKENGSYGLTTLEWHHVSFASPSSVTISFRGKKGVQNTAVCRDPRVIGYLKGKMATAGRNARVFAPITSKDVNAWLLAFDPVAAITSKDIRTWQANQLYLRLVDKKGMEPREALKQVAALMHNTPTVCKKNYIDAHT